MDKQKIDTIFFANCSIGKSFGQTKIDKFFLPTTVHVKFLDKQKNDDFLTSYSAITSPQTSTVKQKEYTATQGVILNKTFVFRLKHPNQKKKRNEKKKRTL